MFRLRATSSVMVGLKCKRSNLPTFSENFDEKFKRPFVRRRLLVQQHFAGFDGQQQVVLGLLKGLLIFGVPVDDERPSASVIKLFEFVTDGGEK